MTGEPEEFSVNTHRPPQWELSMIQEVAYRWDITGEDAEMFLESIDAFGPKSEWVRYKEDESR